MRCGFKVIQFCFDLVCNIERTGLDTVHLSLFLEVVPIVAGLADQKYGSTINTKQIYKTPAC